MLAERPREVLADYFTLQRGTTYKSQLLGMPGPLLLGLATIQRNGGFRRDSLQTYGGDSPDKLLVRPGELYLSLKDVTQTADLLGAVARLPQDYPVGRLTQDTVKLEPNGQVPLGYLYWLLRTPQYREYCRAHATGTTNLGLSREDFLAFPAPEPSMEQLVLCQALDALEEKIELKRRTNETLLGMARALFKSWFVDFDPVRAKSEGRDPGVPQEVADLFPDECEDSELGEIPKGWRVGQLEDVATTTMGLSPTGDSYNDEGIGTPLINGPVEFGDYFPVRSKWTTSPTRMSDTGDLILCVRGSTTGRRVVADGPYCLGRGVCALRSRGVGRTFIYRLVDNELARLLSKTTGSVFPNLSAPDIKQFQVLVPEKEVTEAFDRIAEPLTARVEVNVSSSRTLAALRDGLLPRLISGELRVTQAEKEFWKHL